MGIFNLLLDLIYPELQRCIHCGRLLKEREISGICNHCLNDFNFVEDYCHICGKLITPISSGKGYRKPIFNENNFLICQNCFNNNYYFDKSRSVAIYEGLLRDLIIDFKYNGKTFLADSLGELLYYSYLDFYKNSSIDFLLTIPLHRKKKKKRKYNQAELLARKIGNLIKIPLLQDYLFRIKNNPPLYDFLLF